ncbi:uncharacterized protein DEA37_0009575 [Paragonimus westermani]|uniref:Filamin n=1 Tax=Paragonimus westermani TaxID=34504 RepID=A0A5J4NMR7_9TREM|nr:uncharacterized protein DEA37_0009575 [Paragonimus westermani]
MKFNTNTDKVPMSKNTRINSKEILLVGICGPTRPFEEVKVKHLGNNQYSVSYSVKESGRHWLLVKWGDQHVPGSPFVVDVP